MNPGVFLCTSFYAVRATDTETMTDEDIAATASSATGATLPSPLKNKALEAGETTRTPVNGHGAGHNGIPSATKVNGHDVECVTIAVVGAGQRGLVSLLDSSLLDR